jgi:cytochrome bd-type quinol oxidase subunit 1
MTAPTAPTAPSRSSAVAERRVTVAAVLDVVAITVFVAAGRRTHDQDPGLMGVFTTAAPFLIALALGWVAARAWRRPFAVTTGLIVWVATISIGMPLRNLVFDRGTAMSFVLVATGFTLATLVGWRLLALALDRSRRGGVTG